MKTADGVDAEACGEGAGATSKRVRVVVADDHPMWLEAVTRDLTRAGYDVVGAVSDGAGAFESTVTLRPDVLVLDLSLPVLRGAEVCARLHAAAVATGVLVLSASSGQHDVLEAVKCGASGYLVKSASREELIEAVAATARGESVFTPGLAGLVLGEFRAVARGRPSGGRAVPELTDRETEVLKLVATGLTSRDIAQLLYLSPRTVQNHVQNTLKKLRLHNRVELARFAIDRGLDGGSLR